MLIDNTDNVEYFLFKFNISSIDKKRILFLNKFYNNEINKNYFSKNNLWKIFYYNGKQALFDLIYFPVEQSRGDFHLESFKEKRRFNSQMDKLVSSLNFDIDKNTINCISGTTSHHYLSSKLIAEYFHENFPTTVNLFGGAHASARPNDFTYSKSPIDYVIMGEGEIPLYNFIKNPPKKQLTPTIIKNNPISNLDDMPPLDFSLFDKYIDAFKHLSISLSRG